MNTETEGTGGLRKNRGSLFTGGSEIRGWRLEGQVVTSLSCGTLRQLD